MKGLETIFTTKSFKFVGINIDENLSWDYHISKVKSKISFANIQIVNIQIANIQIAKVKNILPICTLTNRYNALFRPHLEFGVMAWGHVDLTVLSIFQKAATFDTYFVNLFS